MGFFKEHHAKSIKLHVGDVIDVLKTMKSASVHCVITSPPYWGLRDYGVSGQLGLEPTYQEYVDKLVSVFREVRRVLRPDGTLWLNLGDSYAGGGGFSPNAPSNLAGSKQSKQFGAKPGGLPVGNGLKSKDLCGIPWRVALALQADGWWLRQDIIWSKPNPMPESVTDRCTKAHEYLFMLSKSSRYYYDAEAIKEAAEADNMHDLTGMGYDAPGQTPHTGSRGRASGNRKHKGVSAHEASDSEEHRTKAGLLKISCTAYGMRNKRSVWEIATKPFPKAHFATFPPKLVEPCIKAGTSERGCCSKCGAPWERVVDRELTKSGVTGGATPYDSNRPDGMTLRAGGFGGGSSTTLSWQPICKCNAPVIPCTVLDPFFGSGTTALVARGLNRDCIGIELSPEYADMACDRIDLPRIRRRL